MESENTISIQNNQIEYLKVFFQDKFKPKLYKLSIQNKNETIDDDLNNDNINKNKVLQIKYKDTVKNLDQYFQTYNNDFNDFLKNFDIYKDLRLFLKQKYSIQKSNNTWIKLWEIFKTFDIFPKKGTDTFLLLDTSGISNCVLPCVNHYIKSETNIKSFSWFAYDDDNINLKNNLQQKIYTNYKNYWFINDYNNDSDNKNDNNKNTKDDKIEKIIDMNDSNIDLIINIKHIDTKDDYFKQEEIQLPILKLQIELALKTLRKGGTLILKLLNFLTQPTIELLYLLFRKFNTVNFYRPSTCKLFSTEVFLICQNFNSDYVSNDYVLNNDISIANEIYKIQEYFLNDYLNNIDFILNYYDKNNKNKSKNEKNNELLFEELKKYNIKMPVEWLNKNNIKILKKKDKLNLI